MCTNLTLVQLPFSPPSTSTPYCNFPARAACIPNDGSSATLHLHPTYPAVALSAPQVLKPPGGRIVYQGAAREGALVLAGLARGGQLLLGTDTWLQLYHKRLAETCLLLHAGG